VNTTLIPTPNQNPTIRLTSIYNKPERDKLSFRPTQTSDDLLSAADRHIQYLHKNNQPANQNQPKSQVINQGATPMYLSNPSQSLTQNMIQKYNPQSIDTSSE
jgi:hypothetical protein